MLVLGFGFAELGLELERVLRGDTLARLKAREDFHVLGILATSRDGPSLETTVLCDENRLLPIYGLERVTRYHNVCTPTAGD